MFLRVARIEERWYKVHDVFQRWCQEKSIGEGIIGRKETIDNKSTIIDPNAPHNAIKKSGEGKGEGEGESSVWKRSGKRWALGAFTAVLSETEGSTYREEAQDGAQADCKRQWQRRQRYASTSTVNSASRSLRLCCGSGEIRLGERPR